MQAKKPIMLRPCPECKGELWHYDYMENRYVCIVCRKVVKG